MIFGEKNQAVKNKENILTKQKNKNKNPQENHYTPRHMRKILFSLSPPAVFIGSMHSPHSLQHTVVHLHLHRDVNHSRIATVNEVGDLLLDPFLLILPPNTNHHHRHHAYSQTGKGNIPGFALNFHTELFKADKPSSNITYYYKINNVNKTLHPPTQIKHPQSKERL